MRKYTHEQVQSLLDQSVHAAEQAIYAGLQGADNEQRLDSLDTLDALHAMHKQFRIILDREETSHE